jgi:uncharacterized circularly permuted ATP-grasp superfamily protein
VDAVREYHDLLFAADARAEAEALAEGFRQAGILFDGAPMPSFLRPHFVTRAEWNALRGDGVRLLELAARVARRAFGGDARKLCAWLGTPPEQAEWVAVDPGEPDVVLSRLDAFLTPQGPRYIEINSDAPAGFGYGDAMAEVFRTLPTFQRFARTHTLHYAPCADALIDAVRAATDSRSPTVAIVDWHEVKTRPDQEILRERFEGKGLRCRLADPREAAIVGGRLLFEGAHVDVVYRRVLLTELVERAPEVATFLAAYRWGLAAFVNSFRCHLSEDKAFLAFLTDEAFASLLTADERAFVARVVPWTRKVEERATDHAGEKVDLLPWVVRHREELVLKPAHDYGGRSVFIGEETEPAAWEAAVNAAVSGSWVVQERVPISREPFPVVRDDGRLTLEELYLNANPFYVRGGETGGVTRVSRRAVINVSAGGGGVPTFVVE